MHFNGEKVMGLLKKQNLALLIKDSFPYYSHKKEKMRARKCIVQNAKVKRRRKAAACEESSGLSAEIVAVIILKIP